MAKEEKKYIFSEWPTNMRHDTGLKMYIGHAEMRTKGKYLRTECIPQGKGEMNLYIIFCEVDIPMTVTVRKFKRKITDAYWNFRYKYWPTKRQQEIKLIRAEAEKNRTIWT